MKIYFAGAIRGGRNYQPVYAAIVDHLSQQHDVLSAHVAAKNVDEEQGIMTDPEIYQRDIAWLDQAEVVIADVTVPSIGVGYEIAYARGLGKDVICIAHQVAHVSAMVKGDTLLRTATYVDAQDAIQILDRFLYGTPSNAPQFVIGLNEGAGERKYLQVAGHPASRRPVDPDLDIETLQRHQVKLSPGVEKAARFLSLPQARKVLLKAQNNAWFDEALDTYQLFDESEG